MDNETYRAEAKKLFEAKSVLNEEKAKLFGPIESTLEEKLGKAVLVETTHNPVLMILDGFERIRNEYASYTLIPKQGTAYAVAEMAWVMKNETGKVYIDTFQLIHHLRDGKELYTPYKSIITEGFTAIAHRLYELFNGELTGESSHRRTEALQGLIDSVKYWYEQNTGDSKHQKQLPN